MSAHSVFTLSDHVWKLKKKKTTATTTKIDFNIKWEIVKKVKPFAPGEKVQTLLTRKTLHP